MGAGASSVKGSDSATGKKGKKGSTKQKPDEPKKMRRKMSIGDIARRSSIMRRKSKDTDADMARRERAVLLIQRNVRAWKTRKAMEKRLEEKRKREELTAKRQRDAMMKEVAKSKERLEKRRSARENRTKYWNDRKKKLEEEQRKIDEERERLRREQEQKAKEEEERELQERLQELAETELEAREAGIQNPHIIVIANQWPGNNRQIDAAHVTEAHEKAVRSKAKDGGPVRVVVYDWDIGADDLLEKIENAIASEHENARAESLTFFVPHSYGTLFLMKYLPSTQVGILGGKWENGVQVQKEGGSLRVLECKNFWDEMVDMVSVLPPLSQDTSSQKTKDPLADALEKMKDPDALEDWLTDVEKRVSAVAQEPLTKEYSMKDRKITFLLRGEFGSEDENSEKTGELALYALHKAFLSAVVTCPTDDSEEGKEIINNLFEPDKYEKANDVRTKMIQDHAEGLYP